MTGSERRRQPRFKVEVEAQLAHGARRFGGRLKDLCRDAVLVEVSHPLKLGDEVAVNLVLPGTDGPLQAVGRVVRTAAGDEGGHEAAILLADLTPTALTRIDFFIARQSPSA